MLKKTLLTTAIILSLSSFQPAFAADADLSTTKPHEEYKKMSPEERQKFHEERKAKWAGMSKEEKLSVIEKRRAEKKKKMDEKWGSMSDDEKIGFVEKRMKRRAEHRGEHGGEHKGEHEHRAE